MLDPYHRRLLFDLLRPPSGYQLDYMIGTTFSLDLMALMIAPIAFTLFNADNIDDQNYPEVLQLLTALRNYGDKMSIFCQAGNIQLPDIDQPLITYLENVVFEVVVPNETGVFHPKVWILRFEALDGSIRYRLVCLSRNLTFDHSWDMALALEGELGNRGTASAQNNPLSAFVAALPRIVKRGNGVHWESSPEGQRMLTRVKQFTQELRRVKFELPDGFEEIGNNSGVREARG